MTEPVLTVELTELPEPKEFKSRDPACPRSRLHAERPRHQGRAGKCLALRARRTPRNRRARVSRGAQNSGPDLRLPLPACRRDHRQAHQQLHRPHHRGKGDAGDDRQQPRFRCRPLPLRTGHIRRVGPGLPELDAIPADQTLSGDHGQHPDPGGQLRPPARSLPFAPGGAARDHHQRPHGRDVRHAGRFPTPGRTGLCQLRPDDRRWLDVHRPAGHRPRHLHHAFECGTALPRGPRGRQPRRQDLCDFGPGRYVGCTAQGARDLRRRRDRRRGRPVAGRDPTLAGLGIEGLG